MSTWWRRFAFWLYVIIALWLTIFFARFVYLAAPIELIHGTFEPGIRFGSWTIVVWRLVLAASLALAAFLWSVWWLIYRPWRKDAVGRMRYALVLSFGLLTVYLDATKFFWVVPFPDYNWPVCRFGELGDEEHAEIVDSITAKTDLTWRRWIELEKRYGRLEVAFAEELKNALPQKSKPEVMFAHMHALASNMGAKFISTVAANNHYDSSYYLDLNDSFLISRLYSRWIRLKFNFYLIGRDLYIEDVLVLFPEPLKANRQPGALGNCPTFGKQYNPYLHRR